ncbi:MAG: UvrD-helicase domain-containing protein [Bacilli bacterium]
MMIPTKPDNVIWTDEQWTSIYLEGKNIIVSAGAGSGKTAVLTERIIQKLIRGISIKDMIILTFTNAAAFEMKERVKKKIRKAVKTYPQLEKQIPLVEQAIITTFDSFSLSIVKKYHYLLGIPNNIGIIDNVVLNIEKRKILDNIIDNKYDNPKFLSFLDRFTIKDDTLIRNTILSFSNKIDSICKKNEYLENYIENNFTNEFIDTTVDEYMEYIKTLCNTITSLIDAIKNTVTDEKLVDYSNKIEETLYSLNTDKSYKDYKKTIETYKFPKLPTKGEETEKSAIKGYIEKIKSYLSELNELMTYETEEDMKLEILSTKEDIELFIEILLELENKIFSFKKSKNVYEFSDITRLAINILETHPEISGEIKNKTNEIMIDEYQDTNDIGDYLISLISKDNVYMVGDVKQSIYRFRNANPKIFMEKYNNYKKYNTGYAIDLNKNFRSREEVLDGINMMFSKIMDEKIGGANYNEGHNMIYGNKSYINEGKTNQNYNLEIYDYEYKEKPEYSGFSKEEIEAFIIAEDIIKRVKNKEQIFDMENKVLKEIKYSDFVILIDRSSSFKLFKKVFEFKGIPLLVHKPEQFIYSNEIYVLKNLLKLINIFKEKDFINIKYPFISISRSYLFDYDDDLIFSAVTNNDILTNPEFKDLVEKISSLAELSNNISLSNLIIEIYKQFDFYYKSIKISNVLNTNLKLDYIITVAQNLEDIGYSLKDFITYFEEVFEKKLDIQFSPQIDTSSNSVSIMTIHKSKGLEYPICYFPNLYKDFNKADLNSKFLYDSKYGFVLPVYNEGIKETIIKKLVKNNYLKEDIAEKLRALYVALTRAKEKIILISPLKEANVDNLPFQDNLVNELDRLKYQSFEDILKSLKNEVNPFINTKECNPSKNYLLSKKIDLNLQKRNKTFETIEIHIEEQEKDVKTFSHTRNKIEKNKATEFGTEIHEVLEFLDFYNPIEDIENYAISSYFKSCILKLFNQNFIKPNSIFYKEYEFYDNENHGIIDLLIENENEFIIVDYKLKNIEPDYYIEQVKSYVSYIKNITDKKVTGFLYSIIDGETKKVN